MRRGYIYIYYPYLTDWEAWSVCDDGSLWKQLSAKNVLEKSEPDCRQGTYSNGGKDFLTLPYEVLENDIWIAFTQCPWTEKTLERYAGDDGQRQRRMQRLSSSNWTAPQASQQITEATTANLARVLDYIPAQGSQKKKMAASAVVWAASGSGGTASALLQDYDRALCGAWYLTGRINGRRFTGWLGCHWCYEGEEVELLAAPVGEEYLVYAIHKPEEQSLCMTPGCYRGKNQARRAAVRIPLRVCYLCLAVVLITLLCCDGMASFYDPIFYIFIAGTIVFLLVMCLLPAAWSIYKHKPLPEETLSEEIFTLLGWKNVADINLDTLHKRRKKEWQRTGIPPNPLRKGTPFDYSGGTHCFFYY